MSETKFPNFHEVFYQKLITQEGLLVEILSSINGNRESKLQSTNNYLNSKQASKFLSKSPNALRVMVCKNQIKSIKKGSSLYFLESDLIEYLESGRKKTPEELRANFEDILVQKKKGVKEHG